MPEIDGRYPRRVYLGGMKDWLDEAKREMLAMSVSDVQAALRKWVAARKLSMDDYHVLADWLTSRFLDPGSNPKRVPTTPAAVARASARAPLPPVVRGTSLSPLARRSASRH